MFAPHYLAQRDALISLIGDAGADGHEPVPACPGWTVSDVVRHLTGLAEDWTTGNLEIYASAPWTAAQVDRRSRDSLQTVCDAWQQIGDEFAPMLDALDTLEHLPETIITTIGPQPTKTFAPGIVIDLTQHVHDVAGALGTSPDDATATVPLLTQGLAKAVHQVWKFAGHPSVELIGDDSTSLGVLGGGEPEFTVSASTVEIFRALGGRRSLEQLRGFRWKPEAPADDILASLVVPFFALPDTALAEST